MQDVLRARRGVSSLLSPEELRRREAARRREDEERRRQEDEAEAARLVGRWRNEGKRIDAEGRLSKEVYGLVFQRDPDAYGASSHWSRRAKAQLAHVGACEVERCGSADALRAEHVGHDAIGEERPGRDLVTLCDGCYRRARRRSRELGRPVTRKEIRELDPEAPLFDAETIAALRERYDLT